jgi:hypothetical protein
MTARHFYRNDDGDMEEVETVPSLGWTAQEQAEEGSAATFSVTIPDPDETLNFVSHRRWIIYEDESESDDQVLFSGFVTGTDIARTGGEHNEFTGRVWTVNLADMNSLWERRVMHGSDSLRDEETDVERMQWLVATEEMGYFDDLSFLATGTTYTLDERDTRGQSCKSVADECAQTADKNYWIGATGNVTDGTDIFVWYGRDVLPDYPSPLSLSNDPADLDDADMLDGSATTWPYSGDAKVNRSGERVYNGVYVQYENGAIYRKRASTTVAFTGTAGRDLAHPAPEIKTKARAVRRATRLLDSFATELEVFSGTVRLPMEKATQLRAGMLVPSIKAVHVPGWEDGRVCRILSAAPTPAGFGSFYDIAIEAEPIAAASAASCSAAVAQAVAETDSGPEADLTASVSVTAPDDGYVIGILYAANGNTPNAENMGTPAGYTNLDSNADYGRATWFLGYKACSAGSVGMSASFDPGFSTNGLWQAGLAYLPWTALTVVQEDATGIGGGGDMTLPAPPTPGNTIIMVAATYHEGDNVFTLGGTYGPSTGWTELFDPGDVDGDQIGVHVAMWARCVAEGDGVDYGFTYAAMQPTQSFGYIVEIAT